MKVGDFTRIKPAKRIQGWVYKILGEDGNFYKVLNVNRNYETDLLKDCLQLATPEEVAEAFVERLKGK